MGKLAIVATGVFISIFASMSLWADDDMAEASRQVAAAKTRDALLALAAPQTRATAQAQLPRFYKAGDRWVVAVSHLSHELMRKTDESTDDVALRLDPEFYEFKVLSSSRGLATIEIRPRAEKSRVLRTVLLISDKLEIVSKTSYRNGASSAIAAQSPLIGNVVTGFNPVPLVLPDFAGASLTRVPPLDTTSSERHPIDPAKTVRFKEADLFDREVLIDWQQGDLWPARVRTASSLSLLIEQELRK